MATNTDPQWYVNMIKEKEKMSSSDYKKHYEAEPIGEMGIDCANGKDYTSVNVYSSSGIKQFYTNQNLNQGQMAYLNSDGKIYSYGGNPYDENNPYHGYSYSHAMMEQNIFQQKINEQQLKIAQNIANPLFEISVEELTKDMQIEIEKKIEEKPKKKYNRFQLMKINKQVL